MKTPIGLFTLAVIISVVLTVSGVQMLPQESRSSTFNTIMQYISGISVAALPFVFQRQSDLNKTKQEKIKQITSNDIFLRPITAAFYGLLFTSASYIIVSAICGFIFGYATTHIPMSEEEISIAYNEISGVPTRLLTIPLIIIISKYVTHRIRNSAWLWMIGVLLVFETVLRLIDIIFIEEAHLVDYILPTLVLITGEAIFVAIGYTWAKKTHADYVINKLSKQLSPSDKEALIALVSTGSQTPAQGQPKT